MLVKPAPGMTPVQTDTTFPQAIDAEVKLVHGSRLEPTIFPANRSNYGQTPDYTLPLLIEEDQ